MKSSNARVLRVYISTTDKLNGTPLYQLIVEAAREQGMAGSTVLRGVMGYGASASMMSARFWEISEKLPLVVEIIDEEDQLERFFPFLSNLLECSGKGCLVTFQDVGVKMYKSGKKK